MLTSHIFGRLVALAAFGLALAVAAPAQPSFKIGQSAPEFKAGRWLKHGPITKLEPGQIYVLEFWATWCGPCRAAMPHLTDLARKHAGKVTIIGVNILERAPSEKLDRLLDQVITQMGKDLDYPVCRDTADDYLLTHWFKPTRSPAIPESVVVDGNGKIAWIGHPSRLDQVIDELLAGAFDYEKSASDFAKAAAGSNAMMKVFADYGEAMKAGDWAKAIEIIDANPQYAANLWLPRFDALLRHSPSEAFEQLREVVAKKDRNAGNYLGAVSRADHLPREIYQFAAEALVPNARAGDFGALAALFYRLGDSGKAVEYQLKLKEYALSMPQRPPPEVMEKVEEDLIKYRGY